jgi:hypothetical protein
VVGLHIDRPAHADVVSIDEKSQIQALNRTQLGLPLKPGKCGTMAHDYNRNGTTTALAYITRIGCRRRANNLGSGRMSSTRRRGGDTLVPSRARGRNVVEGERYVVSERHFNARVAPRGMSIGMRRA